MIKGLTKKQLLKIVIESEGPKNTHYLKYTNEDLVYSKNHKVFEENTNMNTYQQPFHLSRKLEDDWKDARDPSSKMHLPNSTATKRRPSGSQEKNIQYINSQSSRTSSNNREDKQFAQTMSMPFLGINRPMTNISNNQSTTKKRPLSPMPPIDPASKNKQRANSHLNVPMNSASKMIQKSPNGENMNVNYTSAYIPSPMSDQFSKHKQRANNIPMNSTNKMLQNSRNGENLNVIYAQSAYLSPSPLSDQFSKNKNRKSVSGQQNLPFVRGPKLNPNAKIERSTKPLPDVFYNMDYINSSYNTVDVNSKKENESWLKYPKNFLGGIIQNPIRWETFGPDDNILHRATITLEIAGTTIIGHGDARTKKDAEKIAFLNSCYIIEAQGLMIHLISPSGQRQNIIRQSTQQGSEIDYKKQVIEYCAAFDHVPHFEVFGAGPDHDKQWEAIVELPSQGLIGRGRGRTKKEAEIKAAEAFKKHAEEYKALHGGELISRTEGNTMSEDVARNFIRFYCRFFKFKNPEFGYRGIGPSHSTLWEASLIVQGLTIGSGKRSSKREAQAAAYLDAAIALRKDSPNLWENFETDKTKVKNSNKPPPLINVSISESVSHTLNRLVNDLCDVDILRLDDNKSVDSQDNMSKPDQIFEDQLNQREIKNKSQFTVRYLNTRSEKLYRDHQNYLCSRQTEKIRFNRNQLPITHYSNVILKAIENNPVIVIVGSTGCGKTTQLPQMIFEDAIMHQRGSLCNIIVTQPRRIAAISVAQRVAYERSEKLGQTVGYHVRFDAVEPVLTGSILYCTTGVLLRRMHDEKNGIDALKGVTHIVVDEVHERDMNADFLLVILKQILRERRLNNRSPIKLILMSATIDTGIFSEYFGEFFSTGRCPVVEVPGKIFPVQQFFLEDLVSKLRTHYRPLEAPQLGYSDTLKYVDREMQFAQIRKASELLPQKMKCHTMDIDNEIENICSEIDDDNMSVGSSNDWIGLKHNDIEKANAEIPYNLMTLVIAHIVNTSKEGAILVFLPGLEEIMALNRLLTSPPYPLGIDFSNQSRFRIHFLHSSLPSLSQQEVFESLPNSNMRKIILATNIAETSITIQDIVYVVDSGKVKEKRYDQSKRMTNLITTWISQSNSRQRSGRAGRVREGEYYVMMTRARYQILEGYSTPEMLRSDLQEICLHIKALGLPATIGDVLSQAIQPPDQISVFAALDNLKSLQALDHNEELTSLGKVLATLPMEPGLGKMVLLGAIFQCLDPILTIGASMASKNPFLSPPYAKDRADEIRFYWSQGLACDHFAVLNVYKAWYEIQSSGALQAANKFCSDNLLSKPCLQTIEQIKLQLLSLLERAGVVPTHYPKRDHNHHNRYLALGPPEYNLNSNCIPLLRALICAGVYPNIALKTSKKTFRTRHENATFIHPASVNYKERAAKLAATMKNNHNMKQGNEIDENLITPIGTLYAYSSKVKTSGQQVFLRSTTRIDPLSTILFGGEIRTSNQSNNFLIVDDWLQFFGENSSFALVNKLKILLDRCLTRIYEKLEVTQLNGNNTPQHTVENKSDDIDKQIKIMLVRGIVEVLENSDRDLIKNQQNGNYNRSRLINC